MGKIFDNLNSGVSFEDLFNTDRESPHPDFEQLRSSPHLYPARLIIAALTQAYFDPDGNFLEQFPKSNSFYPRLWELYLDTTFRSLDLEVDRTLVSPDFLLTKNGIQVFVEAVVSSPSMSGSLAINDREISDADLGMIEMLDFFSLKTGSPLFGKINRTRHNQPEYWQLPHVMGKPFVLAIKPCHGAFSHFRTFIDLGLYLYGVRPIIAHQGNTPVHLGYLKAQNLSFREKQNIPGGFFFGNPAISEITPNVSGVLFNNQGGLSSFLEFAAVAFRDHLPDNIGNIIHFVETVDNDGIRTESRYSLRSDEPRFVSWESGLVYFHNPNAINPVPIEFFGESVLQISFDRKSMQSVILNSPNPFLYRSACLVEVQNPSGLLLAKYVY